TDGNKTHVDYVDCGLIHLQQGRPEAALDAALAAIKCAQTLRLSFAPAYRLAAVSCLRLGKYKEALGYSDMYLIFGPPLVEIFELRVFAHTELGNIAEVPAEYDRALKIKPNDPMLLTARGWVYLFSDAPKFALPDFQKVISLDPNHAYAHTGLGE